MAANRQRTVTIFNLYGFSISTIVSHKSEMKDL